MKVLHLSSALSWRGGEQQIAYLIEELKEKDITNIIFCPEHTPLESHAKSRGFETMTYKKKNLNPSVAKKLKAACIQYDIEVIHLHDSHAHTYGVMAHSLYGNKVPMILSRRVDFPIKRNFLSKWKYNHKGIVKILCVSRAIQKILEPDIKDQNKLEVVYSGIDPERIKNPMGKFRKEYGIQDDELIIANIASIAPHKDYFTFVRTIKALKDKWVNTIAPFPKVFIIGGDGGEESSIAEYIKQNDLSTDIIMTGFREDIGTIIGEIDVLLVTSKEEGLCTTILDAFTAEVPVVATTAGGIPEIILHLQTGLLAPIKDYQKLSFWILKVLEDQNLKERILRKAGEYVLEFHKQKMAIETMKYYSSSLRK